MLMLSRRVPAETTGDFTPERWGRLTEPLRRLEGDLAKLAAEKALELHASSRWPELSLRCRSVLTVNEARISLDPKSLNDGVPRWAVRVVKYPRWPLFGSREAIATEIAVLTDEEARSERRLVDEMSRAVQALPRKRSIGHNQDS